MSQGAMPIRLFNADGISAFRAYLETVKAGQRIVAPLELLVAPTLTQRVLPDTVVEPAAFQTTLEIVRYLHPRIINLNLPDKLYNAGLWSWLGAYYFDLICPIENNTRRVGEEGRYISVPRDVFRGRDRHLLAAAFRFYDSYPTQNDLMTYTSPSKRSEFLRILSETQELSSSSGVMEALHILYWDKEKQRPKRSSFPDTAEPGSLRRFVALLNQFSLTFDLQGMSGRQIIQLLPKREFDRWK